jgi:pimeloyl-ACP methyl ester carboxylesterase
MSPSAADQPKPEPALATVLAMDVANAGPGRRSPFLAIAGSLLAGFTLAIAFLLGPALGGSEATITGSVLLAFGIGWALMAFLSTRFSSQPQRWMRVPAVVVGVIGLGLIVFQPSPKTMDLLSWIWPPAVAALAVWMTMQVRVSLSGRGRWLVVPTTAVLLLFAVGGGLETVFAATAPAGVGTGQLVDVGGHRLFISCTGTGGPTVVLESGLGETSSYWGLIAPNVATSTRVCVYDRAGRGRSDDVVGTVDGMAAAKDLHALLAGSGNVGPYVLVGHSSGGVYVRIFASMYPTEVAGMVLLDSQPSDAFTSLPAYPGQYAIIRPTYALFASAARLGIFRLAEATAFGDLPPEARAAERADQSSPRLYANTSYEWAELPTALQESATLTSLGSTPLVVVEAGSGAPEGWHAAQQRLAKLSTNSSYRFEADTVHIMLIEGATESHAATTAILDVVAAVRTGEPVAER